MCEGFCYSLSLLILRFTFVELFLSKKKKNVKIYKHKSMHVSRLTKLLTNHSWQVWRSIYNNHIDVKISPTMIWVHREQAMLVNAQGHLAPYTSYHLIFLNQNISLWDRCLKFSIFQIDEQAFDFLSIIHFHKSRFPFFSVKY